MTKQKKINLYSGGLAEFVSDPSALTFSFFQDWFTGTKSVGKAMDLLGLPHEKVSLPLLTRVNHEVFVNLSHEERTFFLKTCFSYKEQIDFHTPPTLSFTTAKCVSLVNIINTLQLLFKQSVWIAYPDKTVQIARYLVDKITDNIATDDLVAIDKKLSQEVFPYVIATGILCEFYYQLIAHESKDVQTLMNTYISAEIQNRDWFFKSIKDQELVRNKTIALEEYIKKYGLRSDKDYELTSPRWYEIPKELNKRIYKNTTSLPVYKNDFQQKLFGKQLSTANTIIELLVLRSEAKRKALIHIDHLRKNILQKHNSSTSDLTRNSLLGISRPEETSIEHSSYALPNIIASTHGKGRAVSAGQVQGAAQIIDSPHDSVEKETIGIFPNASPEFAILFPKCKGIIFLKGSATSHGAIVAREFGIPAIVDNNASFIENNASIKINGSEGTWEIIQS